MFWLGLQKLLIPRSHHFWTRPITQLCWTQPNHKPPRRLSAHNTLHQKLGLVSSYKVLQSLYKNPPYRKREEPSFGLTYRKHKTFSKQTKQTPVKLGEKAKMVKMVPCGRLNGPILAKQLVEHTRGARQDPDTAQRMRMRAKQLFVPGATGHTAGSSQIWKNANGAGSLSRHVGECGRFHVALWDRQWSELGWWGVGGEEASWEIPEREQQLRAQNCFAAAPKEMEPRPSRTCNLGINPGFPKFEMGQLASANLPRDNSLRDNPTLQCDYLK